MNLKLIMCALPALMLFTPVMAQAPKEEPDVMAPADGCIDMWIDSDGVVQCGTSGLDGGASFPKGKCGPKVCSFTKDGETCEVIFGYNAGYNYCIVYSITDGICSPNSGWVQCALLCK